MTWRDNAQDFPFVSFKGGPFTGKFLGGKEVRGEDRTGDGKKWGDCIEFTFETEDGKEKTLQTSSKRLIGMMSAIPDGTLLKINRTGVSTETIYDVSVIEKPTMEYLAKINEKNAAISEPTAEEKAEAEKQWEES